MSDLEYVCDGYRHLVCLPYSVENLHRMARELGIHRGWFHSSPRFPHYDIPKRRISEIMKKCRVVSSREIIAIIYDYDSKTKAGPAGPQRDEQADGVSSLQSGGPRPTPSHEREQEK